MLPLPSGATTAGLTTINTPLGSLFQAAGSIGNAANAGGFTADAAGIALHIMKFTPPQS
jgi:hypothetical protein